MDMKTLLRTVILLLLVSGCSKTQSQSQYAAEEVGQPVTIEYAEVFNVRPVEITGHASAASTSSPVGASVGGVGGPAGAYMGNEIGSIWGSGMGAAEQAASDKKGYEYTVVTESHITKTLVQYQNPEDIVFKPGDLVMLQNTGSFHRLLSTANLPAKITKPHLVKIEDESLPPLPPPVIEPPKPEEKKDEKKEEKKDGTAK